MRKTFSCFLLCIIILFAFPLPVFARNQINSIDIEAVVDKDGSMYIKQSWETDFDEGTESYIPMHLPNYTTLTMLKVSDQNGDYQQTNDWNIDWSFAKKAKKYGIHHTKDGDEICFGISQYGKNRYTIEYKLDNIISSYPDKDGVNFRFVNDQMNTTPTNVTVQIRLADGTDITDTIADIWGFGFEGEVAFENGAIIAHTKSPIKTQNHVTILFGFQKGVLSPSHQATGTFEEIRQTAFEGSDYSDYSEDEVSVFGVILFLLLAFVMPIALIILIYTLRKKAEEKRRRTFSEQFGYFREIPNEGNISATYVLGYLFNICKEDSILATGILRLIELGCLSPINMQKVGFMGKTKDVVNLQLLGRKQNKMNEYDEYLYKILEVASGKDNILQPKELERFANQNDKLLRAFIQKHDDTGRAYLMQKQCFKQWKLKAKFADLTPFGQKELGELLGLKRYLEDFSLIAERGIAEIPIWRELLTYAMLFGIANQVAEQMKELYPQLSEDISVYTQSVSTAYSYNYLLYSNMIQAEQQRIQEQRSHGSGGFTSFGGGGGSFGGGSGGGTR